MLSPLPNPPSRVKIIGKGADFMRICKKCGAEFDTHGRAFQVCPDCRTEKKISDKIKRPPGLMFSWSNGFDEDDFRYCSEKLFCTRTTYVLRCQGGPLSQYRRFVGENALWNQFDRQLTLEQAKEWGQSHMIDLGELFQT